MTIEEAEKQDAFIKIEVAFNQEQLNELYKKYTESFEENFTQDDKGWWTANADIFGLVKMKVDGNTMITDVPLFDEVNLHLDYKISIPKEARDATEKE